MKNYLLNKEIRLHNLFNDKLATLEIHPSDDAWDKVHASLQAKAKKSRITWLVSVAATIAILLTAALTWNAKIAIVPANEQLHLEIVQTMPEYNHTHNITPNTVESVVAGSLIEDFNGPVTHIENPPAMQSKTYQASGVDLPNIEVNDHILTEIHYKSSLQLERYGPYVEHGYVLLKPKFIRKSLSDLPAYDNTSLKKVFVYISKVKNGEKKLIEMDLVKVRKDLFAMAGNVILKSETQPLN